MPAPFKKAFLLYNPFSGKARKRLPDIQRALIPLRMLAEEIIVEPTRAAGSGGQQARDAIANGCDLILACGGDGTVLDILQGVVNSRATLGVLPFGTANILASDLDLSQNLVRAARRLVNYVPTRIAAGRICYESRESRYFTVAAGVGVHAELIYHSNVRAKQAGGFIAYYLSGFRLLFAHEFLPFEIEVTRPDGTTYRDTVLEVVGMRVRGFGKLLSGWRPGSSLESPLLHLVVLRESSRTAMVKYVFGAIAGTAKEGHTEADVSFVPCTRVRCTPIATSNNSNRHIRCQADGEMLGLMPVEMEIVPDALTMLMPPTANS